VYSIAYLDCIHVKTWDAGTVRVKAAYLALDINLAGKKELLGIWIAQTEGAKFWLQVVTELKNRGVQDIFIACVDGLKGFPESIAASRSALHRPYDALQSEPCQLEATKGSRCRSAPDLRCCHG